MQPRGENRVEAVKVLSWCENNSLTRPKVAYELCTSKNRVLQVQRHRKSHRKRHTHQKFPVFLSFYCLYLNRHINFLLIAPIFEFVVCVAVDSPGLAMGIALWLTG